VSSYRYLTQHAVSGDVLAWDLPLSDVEFGPELWCPRRRTRARRSCSSNATGG
jgi:hypothetical protein